MFGFSSQLASPLLYAVLETMLPESVTGIRDFDSTFVCACSATCSWSIATAGSGPRSAPAAAPTSFFSSSTSARSCLSSARNASRSLVGCAEAGFVAAPGRRTANVVIRTARKWNCM
jgi:hypothetical protein